jgi:cobalt-zinc-cadmium efflux system membrane fusion protein
MIQERLHLPAQIKVNAERTVAIAAPAEGVVQSVLVSPGAAVKKGQALVAIQSPAVAQWRAELSSALQRASLARTSYRREKTLWEERISARQDLDAAEGALKEAEIAAQAARQRLSALGIDTSGGVSSVVTVRAPLDGVVIEKPVVAGQAVDVTKPLLTVADLSQVWVEAAVPADKMEQVGTGMPAKISATALPKELDGTVSFVGPVLGETTRMATARVTLPNQNLRLRPGMLASVDLMGSPSNVPVTVASDAIQIIHERNVVFIRTAHGFKAQDVTIGRSDGKRTEIVKGLTAGISYAAAGSFLLKADLGKAEAEHDD